MQKKKLVIIAGVTGAIGTALLEQYGVLKNTIVLGISRQAQPFEAFIDDQTGKLHTSTLICSLPQLNKSSCNALVASINFENISEIIYIHCIGAYLFEIDARGKFFVAEDHDNDKVDDRCTLLSYNLFRWMTEPLIEHTKSKLTCSIFGSLADRHTPRIIHSWWKTMSRVKKYMRSAANQRVGMHVFNISSVFCPHEIITRPFVFINTKADPRMWLSPYKLATRVRKQLRNDMGGYHAIDVLTPWSEFFPTYYSDHNMVPRRLAETNKK
jgi:hypothetical protein